MVGATCRYSWYCSSSQGERKSHHLALLNRKSKPAGASARACSGVQPSVSAKNLHSGSIAEINALYVLPDRLGRGIGGSLLREAASELATLGFSALHVGVLAANLPAREFYEAMGGREIGQRMFDEEGYLLPMTIYAWSDIRDLVGEPAISHRSRTDG